MSMANAELLQWVQFFIAIIFNRMITRLLDSMGMYIVHACALQLLGFANVSAPLDYVIDYSALCIEINTLNLLENRKDFVLYVTLYQCGKVAFHKTSVIFAVWLSIDYYFSFQIINENESCKMNNRLNARKHNILYDIFSSV